MGKVSEMIDCGGKGFQNHMEISWVCEMYKEGRCPGWGDAVPLLSPSMQQTLCEYLFRRTLPLSILK
jgi:hypothetical protein